MTSRQQRHQPARDSLSAFSAHDRDKSPIPEDIGPISIGTAAIKPALLENEDDQPADAEAEFLQGPVHLDFMHRYFWGKTFSAQLSRQDSKWYGDAGQVEAPLLLALEFMGGSDVFTDCPASRTELHHVILQGVPGKALDRLISNVVVLSPEQVGEAVGVSTRTLRRRREAPEAPLSPEQGGRAFRFAELLARAAVIFGGQEEAERWFDTPAMGLDQQKPIDLIATQVGAQLVDEFLGRLEHGVYA